MQEAAMINAVNVKSGRFGRALNSTRGEHLASASTVQRDLRERRSAQRFPGFADKEQDGGSTPPAPTTPALSSAFAGLSVQLWMGWAGEDGSAVGRALNC